MSQTNSQLEMLDKSIDNIVETGTCTFVPYPGSHMFGQDRSEMKKTTFFKPSNTQLINIGYIRAVYLSVWPGGLKQGNPYSHHYSG